MNVRVVSLLDDYTVRTITTDNDIGFGKWPTLEKRLQSTVYFCHPYHSWEKGLVENCNRWLREFIPKKTDLQSISPDFLSELENYFNHKPRECLAGRTAHEVMTGKEYGMLVESLEINLPKLRIEG